jgi:hypothetical protein
MLSLEPLIIARIDAQVPGFKTVGNATTLAGLRDIGPLLPGVFVIPGGGEPMVKTIDALPAQEIQDWDLIVIIAHQADETNAGLTEAIAGAFMTAVFKALQGWTAGPNQRKGFIYQGRQPPSYSIGYAEFPMTFTAHAVIGQ